MDITDVLAKMKTRQQEFSDDDIYNMRFEAHAVLKGKRGEREKDVLVGYLESQMPITWTDDYKTESEFEKMVHLQSVVEVLINTYKGNDESGEIVEV